MDWNPALERCAVPVSWRRFDGPKFLSKVRRKTVISTEPRGCTNSREALGKAQLPRVRFAHGITTYLHAVRTVDESVNCAVGQRGIKPR